MRTAFNWIGGILAPILAIASLYVALNKSFTYGQLGHDDIGKLIVKFWAIIPPMFFWIDWVVFCHSLPQDDRDIATHTHDLSRNIWLGLVGILAYAFFGRNL